MNPSYRIELIKLLENLPYFLQQEICDQLDEQSLLLVSLISEKWEKTMEGYRGKEREEFVWDITLSKNVLMIYLRFEDEKKKKENFQIGFKEDPNSSEDFYVQHDRRWNCYTFYYKTANQLEESSFKALQLLSHLFPPSRYHRITVPLGPRCPDFPFRFLSQLPRGNAKYVDLQADQAVECADLLKFLGNNILIRSFDLKIADARFMTRESLEKLDAYYAEIGENNFTSQDFNAFFRAWTRGGKTYELEKISFAIREDQKIDMEEVLKGLDVHVDEERVRDRWHLHFPNGCLYMKAVDCGKAHTVFSDNWDVGAILLEPNSLSFYAFSPENNRHNNCQFIRNLIDDYKDRIHCMKSFNKKCEQKVAAQGSNADPEDLEKLVRGLERIAADRKRLRKARDVQMKMLLLWSNSANN